MSTFVVKAWLAGSALADRMRREEEGQTLTEYALILGLIVAAGVAVLATIGGKVGVKLTSISNLLN